ncbi:MAG: mannose-6-phosphate isomerase, class I [Desulfobacterales bacterium]|nr:mannose-6-phosphate isomerase, class I [Desulfobacterales bacterium]
MERISILKNKIQNYAWGSLTAIPELLSEKPDGKPQAELWMGAHPKASSMVREKDGWTSLSALIEKKPTDILGKHAVERFGPSLPYLFKVLAAVKPLSIQAHPSIEQARAGFENENKLGIPLTAPHRNYKDSNHKPECICALTPFWALCGFRPFEEMISLFEEVCPMCLFDDLTIFKLKADKNGFKRFFKRIVSLESGRRGALVEAAATNAAKLCKVNPVFEWMNRLYREYPGDIGIFAPVLLNLICLEPGQALYLPAGELHSYLDGTGIELMANSDNVLRGGLTPKYVDIEELLKILNFEARTLDILTPVSMNETTSEYVTPAEEFILSVINLSEGQAYKSKQDHGVEIMLCVSGRAVIEEDVDDKKIAVEKGDSFVIPASAGGYIIKGTAKIFMALVPF